MCRCCCRGIITTAACDARESMTWLQCYRQRKIIFRRGKLRIFLFPYVLCLSLTLSLLLPKRSFYFARASERTSLYTEIDVYPAPHLNSLNLFALSLSMFEDEYSAYKYNVFGRTSARFFLFSFSFSFHLQYTGTKIQRLPFAHATRKN